MSVISVERMFRRGGTSDRDGADSTRAWRVTVNDRNDNEFTIIPQMAGNIQAETPQLGMRVDNISAKMEDDKGWSFWWVEASYTNRPVDPNKPDDDGDKDPLNDPTEIDWDSGEGVEVIKKDLDDKPILNSAKDRFDEDAEQEVARPVLVITKNFATFEGKTAFDYVNTVNKSEFQGAEPGTLRLRKIRARKQIRNTTKYWSVTFEFAYDPNGWQLEILDRGYYTLSQLSGQYVKKPIKDGNGEDVKKPQLLDGNGTLIDTDDLKNGLATEAYLNFRTREEKDFNQLNLGLV